MPVEQILSIIKPDAFKRANAICARLADNNFTIVAKKTVQLSWEEADRYYAPYRQLSFYNDFLKFMTSGPIVLMILEREDAIKEFLRLKGPTDPAKASVGTLRKEFGVNVKENAIHGSDTAESAAREIDFFFPAGYQLQRHGEVLKTVWKPATALMPFHIPQLISEYDADSACDYPLDFPDTKNEPVANSSLNTGTLYLVSGPSAAGKSTLLKQIIAKVSDIKGIVSYTTREKRPDEKEGVDYHYITFAEFESRRKEFSITFEFGGHHYGALRKDFADLLSQGIDVVFDVDHTKLTQIKTEIPNCVTIFVMPDAVDMSSSIEVLDRRLQSRAGEKTSSNDRLARAQTVINHCHLYDHFVTNRDDKLNNAFDEIKAIIHVNRTKVWRQESKQSGLFRKNELPTVYKELSRIPRFTNVKLNDIKMEPLIGWGNFSYKITHGVSSYVFRIPRKTNAYLVNRADECRNLKPICAAGWYSATHYFDRDGMMLSDFIPATTAVNPGVIQSKPEMIGQIAIIFKQLHDSNIKLQNKLDMQKKIDLLFNFLKDMQVKLPGDIEQIYSKITIIFNALNKTITRYVPCHNDPTPHNFLLAADGSVKLIDWEYSGSNDPFWDLGNFAAQSDLNSEQEKTLLSTYLQRDPSEAELQRLQLYKPIVQLWLYLWLQFQLFTENKNVSKAILSEVSAARYQKCQECLSKIQPNTASSKQLSHAENDYSFWRDRKALALTATAAVIATGIVVKATKAISCTIQ